MRLEAQALTKSPDVELQPPPIQFLLHIQQQFQRRQCYELLSCVFGLLGVILMLVENEVLQNNDTQSGKLKLTALVLKSCVSVSTVLLLSLLVLRYRCDGRIHQLQSSVPSKSTKFSFWRPFLLVLELFICGFHIPPTVGGEFEIVQLHGAPSVTDTSVCEPSERGLNCVRRADACYLVYQYPVEVLGVFMAARLYLLARFVRSSSALHSPWISLVGSLNGVDTMKPSFHFKAIFQLHPLHVLMPLTALITLLTAAIVRILERPAQASFDNFWKSVWFTIVTLSGTGLGDHFPVTYLGRGFSIMGGMFCGVLIVALIQSLFFNFLDLSPKEKEVKYLIELGLWEKATRQNAARLLQATWRSVHLRRDSDQRHLFSMIRTARSLRIKKPIIELSVQDQIAEMEVTVLAELDKMEIQKMQVLKRIQAKAIQLAALRKIINNSNQVT